ncbi:hypothetical protein Scep_007813 [Stephania cephalantha]|uniref:Uncharacterized protein n=1 Tax=Stephania cephalantha TaxID=152367 RepID=A0AAP0KAL0_9MAGN
MSNDRNEGGNVVQFQTASATNSHVFDQISSQVVTDPTATTSNTGGQIKNERGKAKNVALDQHLAKSNGIKPKVNIPDGKLKPVGAWAAEFTTELGIICRTYAPIRVAQWKKVEQKDKEQIYDLIRKSSEANTNNRGKAEINHCSGSKSFARYQHELEDDGESVGPIEFWKKTHYTEKAMEVLKKRQDEMDAMFQSAMEKYNTSSCFATNGFRPESTYNPDHYEIPFTFMKIMHGKALKMRMNIVVLATGVIDRCGHLFRRGYDAGQDHTP